MKYLFATVVCMLFLGCKSSDTLVQTSYGTVAGKQTSKVKAYLGIPYAQPPVGDLRWEDPLPPQPWQGNLAAHSMGDACTQYGSGLPIFFESEDCLTLNIWVPKTPGPHPVMFWVHGGAQMSGSSSEWQYSGAALAAAQNVIVVSANYRLLVSGFFALPATGSLPPIKGNQAIKDLIAALKWVNSEINQFGGDSENITLFGESAGSTNVCALLATPKTRDPDLFQRVIMQSGACDTLGVMSPERAQQEGLALLNTLGCGNAEEPLQCARNMPIEAVRKPVKGNLFGTFSLRLDEWPYQIGLVIDGDVFPESPITLLKNHPRSNTPIMLGSNHHEGSLFAGFMDHPKDKQEYLSFLDDRYPGRGATLAQHYPLSNYQNAGEAHADLRGDMIMKCPALNMARLYSANNPVWFYSLTHIPFSPFFEIVEFGFGDNAPELGVFHSADVGFLFEFPFLTAFFRQSDRDVRDFMQQAWGNFARHGDPNGNSSMVWRRFDIADDNYLNIKSKPINEVKFRQGACDFWFDGGYGF